jgi:hypothetical protein
MAGRGIPVEVPDRGTLLPGAAKSVRSRTSLETLNATWDGSKPASTALRFVETGMKVLKSVVSWASMAAMAGAGGLVLAPELGTAPPTPGTGTLPPPGMGAGAEQTVQRWCT